jgi:4-methyl-5(b-hydroxyethyl)-thiazole monophosphate biosynthesis
MASAKHVLVPLAEGFEEIEAVAVIDVLRRGGIEVIVASLANGPPPHCVRGAHGIAVEADLALGDVDPGFLDAIVLPGGMPGTLRLAEDARVLELVRGLHAAGRPTAAICAAPLVLHAAGVIDGVSVTSHPSVRAKLGGARVVDAPRVVKSGSIWTSQGPGTAIEFGLAIVAELVGEERAAELASAMRGGESFRKVPGTVRNDSPPRRAT